ncbi:hypothetical protein AN958_09999 [Leucoagaricus sp. SymC.cos]|nr:hypothetical protein AN958_09999 [Leucoagaricus sp. SymC.cos]
MFLNVLQPPSISLFSSTGSDPLQIWSVNIDITASSGSSVIQLLRDSDTGTYMYGTSNNSRPPHERDSITASLIAPPALVELGGADASSRNTAIDNEELGHNTIHRDRGYELDQTVLHIQSPKLPTTYIQCPPGSFTPGTGRTPPLGLKHPWIHLQVRNLGREWSFEVGIVDSAGRTGVLRMSTFQKHPKLKLNQTGENSFPLLHLPLSFPSRSSRPLTAWTTINLHLPNFVPYFSHSNLLQEPDGQGNPSGHSTSSPSVSQSWERAGHPGTAIPAGAYSHIAFIRVYATCRLRRIWLDGSGPDQTFPSEFDLFSAD